MHKYTPFHFSPKIISLNFILVFFSSHSYKYRYFRWLDFPRTQEINPWNAAAWNSPYNELIFFSNASCCAHKQSKKGEYFSERSLKYFVMKALCEIREIQRRHDAFVVNKYIQSNYVLLYSGDAWQSSLCNIPFLFWINRLKEILLSFTSPL